MQTDDRAYAMRVKFDRGSNMFASFFADLTEVRRQIGDEQLPSWCVNNLKLGLSVIRKVSGILKDADAIREREALRRAKEIEQEARKAAREAKKKEAAEQRRLREAAKAAKQPPPLPPRTGEPSAKTKQRQRRIDRIAIDEVRRAVAARRISIFRGAKIAGAPPGLQAELLQAALVKAPPPPPRALSAAE